MDLNYIVWIQVGTLDPKAANDENCTGSASDGSNSWYTYTPLPFSFSRFFISFSLSTPYLRYYPINFQIIFSDQIQLNPTPTHHI